MPFTIFESAIGAVGVAWSDAGVTAIQLPEATPAATRRRLAARTPAEPSAATPPAWVLDAIGALQSHLAGRPADLSAVRLDAARVPPFARRVYEVLRRVPPGHTVSYGELARLAGSPGAARAVGRAMATNPFPLVVPCHRVLAAGGKPGGFSAFGGLVAKERLLAIERSSSRESNAPPWDTAAAVRRISSADPVLGRFIGRTGSFALELKHTKDVFDALAEAIVHQQLSAKAAATIHGRVAALFPDQRITPEGILRSSDAALRGAGLSRAKLASLRDLAERTRSGSLPPLEALRAMDDEAIVEVLSAVRGVGRWTAEMLLIFRLGRPDVLPLADFGIRKGFARVFRSRAEMAAPAEVARRAERWRPYRTVASWYLWRACDASGGNRPTRQSAAPSGR